MASLKIVLVLFIALFLLVQGITDGALLRFVVPGDILGRVYCNLGGLIINPYYDLGWMKFSPPSGDDLAIAILISAALLFFVLRPIRKASFKWIAAAVITTILIVDFFLKVFGFLMISWAENSYGFTECANLLDVGLFQIQYSWFQPLFIVGIVGGIVTLAGILLKFRDKNMGQ